MLRTRVRVQLSAISYQLGLGKHSFNLLPIGARYAGLILCMIPEG
ncbi:hypothetical protein [Moorena sp. SIO2C4]|nr:hypothetical protein [Moorena sp. SIO2C4]